MTYRYLDAGLKLMILLALAIAALVSPMHGQGSEEPSAPSSSATAALSR